MGAGGRMSSANGKSSSDEHGHSLPRMPTGKPPFTLADIKRAIPPHCFRRSILRSSSYVVRDLAAASALFYLAVVHLPQLPTPLRLLAWPLYWAAQGCVFMALWLLAHEYGHHGFSEHYARLDDAVGMALHTVLLVPYFSWKYSHRRHHANTGSLHRDETFVPRRKAEVSMVVRWINSSLPGRVVTMAISLSLGWPLYAGVNYSGRRYDRFASHFYPYSPMYTDSQRVHIFASDAGVLAMAYVLFRLACRYSVGWVVRVYGAPLTVTNGLLVLMVYLQHVHAALPYYDDAEWDWLRGTLSTVDRDYGVLTGLFHHVNDTHVLHHLFPAIPHYHAVEATAAIRSVLGEYYRFDATPVWKAMWREARECLYVEPDGAAGDGSSDSGSAGILWYRNSF